MVRILVADDEEKLRSVVASYLEREGFNIRQAANGREAMAAVQQDTFNLVILDLMMPEIDGWSVLRELRKESNVPVILLTARGDEVDRVLGLELGADDYVTKPFGYSDELPLVYTDRERLEQVLINLLANAARYTPRGGRIRVGAESDGKTVRIGVEDNGPGIDPEDVPFVFERFYKADRSRTRSQGAGTGLGLAIVKSITENLGGKVSVTSTPGHGARFTVELPLGDR